MSYVLNALRRAEAERARGSVPDLHAQTGGPIGGDPVRRERSQAWRWGLGALVVVLLLALTATLWPRGDAKQPMVASDMPPAVPVTAAPVAPARVAAPVPPPVLIRIEAPAAARRVPPAVQAAARSDDSGAVVKLQDLPQALQRQLPTLKFGGAMDSPVASQRMLIVNGQVLREGNDVAPGVVLEHIALRTAIVRFKGQRIELAY